MVEDDNKKALALIRGGTELAGSAVSGALGFFAAGPAGAAAASVAGAAITSGSVKLIGDFADRQLSSKEQERVGATAALAFNKISKKSENGEHLREKTFFEPSDGARSEAEELLEGTLRQAREEYKEKKLQFLGNFYSNLVFSPGVTSNEANYYLRLFDNLTYRQFCAICIVFMLPYQNIRETDYRGYKGPLNAEMVSLLQEIYDLNDKGVVACKAQGDGYSALLGWHDVVPRSLELTGLGERLQTLFMAGGSLTTSDLDLVADKLR
ncbi:hypothetical protein [Chromohalobacter sp. 11-W]|uniref:hypothetical protein n=1 Tax=Chromohalobacter sp. 11-W TaxID=2994061 RepID=UPI0024691C56|nr:hypothetical protein [Chromohalobacter sp. 11-W]